MTLHDIVINNGDLMAKKIKKIQCGFDWFYGICSWDFNSEHNIPINSNMVNGNVRNSKRWHYRKRNWDIVGLSFLSPKTL